MVIDDLTHSFTACSYTSFIGTVKVNILFMFKGIAVACCDSYGVGSGMIAIRVVRCLGSETNVTTCSYVNNTVLRSNQMDVGVQCEQGE